MDYEIPIQSLAPDTPPPADKSLHAIVTLVWPYSSSTQQYALLLAASDFRLRRRGGQVRVRFTGSCATAVAEARVAIGDELSLRLDGAAWALDGEVVNTPGRSVGGELVFATKVRLRVLRPGQRPLDVTFVPPSQPDRPVLEDVSAATRDGPVTPVNGAHRPVVLELDGPVQSKRVYDSPAFSRSIRRSMERRDLDFWNDAFFDDVGDGPPTKRKRISFDRLKWELWDKVAEDEKKDTRHGSEEDPSTTSQGQVPVCENVAVSLPTTPDAGVDIDMGPPSERMSFSQNLSNIGLPPLPPPQTSAQRSIFQNLSHTGSADRRQDHPTTPELRPITSPTLQFPSPLPASHRQPVNDTGHVGIVTEHCETVEDRPETHDLVSSAEELTTSIRDTMVSTDMSHDDTHSPVSSKHTTPQSEREKLMARTLSSLFGFNKTPNITPEKPLHITDHELEDSSNKWQPIRPTSRESASATELCHDASEMHRAQEISDEADHDHTFERTLEIEIDESPSVRRLSDEQSRLGAVIPKLPFDDADQNFAALAQGKDESDVHKEGGTPVVQSDEKVVSPDGAVSDNSFESPAVPTKTIHSQDIAGHHETHHSDQQCDFDEVLEARREVFQEENEQQIATLRVTRSEELLIDPSMVVDMVTNSRQSDPSVAQSVSPSLKHRIDASEIDGLSHGFLTTGEDLDLFSSSLPSLEHFVETTQMGPSTEGVVETTQMDLSTEGVSQTFPGESASHDEDLEVDQTPPYEIQSGSQIPGLHGLSKVPQYNTSSHNISDIETGPDELHHVSTKPPTPAEHAHMLPAPFPGSHDDLVGTEEFVQTPVAPGRDCSSVSSRATEPMAEHDFSKESQEPSGLETSTCEELDSNEVTLQPVGETDTLRSGGLVGIADMQPQRTPGKEASYVGAPLSPGPSQLSPTALPHVPSGQPRQEAAGQLPPTPQATQRESPYPQPLLNPYDNISTASTGDSNLDEDLSKEHSLFFDSHPDLPSNAVEITSSQPPPSETSSSPETRDHNASEQQPAPEMPTDNQAHLVASGLPEDFRRLSGISQISVRDWANVSLRQMVELRAADVTVIQPGHTGRNDTSPRAQRSSPPDRKPTRRSKIPEVLRKWFSPRRSSTPPVAEAGQQQEAPTDRTNVGPSPAASINRIMTGVTTPLGYIHPLSALYRLVNPGSRAEFSSACVDVIVVVTKDPKKPKRAKRGLKDFYITLHVTDMSMEPGQSIRVEVYRPWMATLPVAQKGDVVLMRQFAPNSRDHQPFLISTSISSWCVWRYGEGDPGSDIFERGPTWARRTPSGSDADPLAVLPREEVKGPPVELGTSERSHVLKLRRWWTNGCAVDQERGEEAIDGEKDAPHDVGVVAVEKMEEGVDIVDPLPRVMPIDMTNS